MNLRAATAADANAIAALHAASWQAAYASVLSASYLQNSALSERRTMWTQRLRAPQPNQYVVVADRDGKIVGFACAFLDEHVDWGSYLDNLHVSAALQGQGIGTRLMADVVSRCQSEAPGRGLYLSVNQANHRAQRFYYQLGARNAAPGVWNAPDGSQVPTYWFVWDTLGNVASRTE